MASVAVCRKITWGALIPKILSRPGIELHRATTRDHIQTLHIYLTEIFVTNFFLIAVQIHMHCIQVWQNIVPFIQCTITSGKVPTYVYVYICKSYVYLPYVAVIKRPDILQIIIQYSAEILWLYSYRPFTNKMHTYISMPVYTTQRSSIFATHTHCHQRPSRSNPYLFTCNIKER